MSLSAPQLDSDVDLKTTGKNGVWTISGAPEYFGHQNARFEFETKTGLKFSHYISFYSNPKVVVEAKDKSSNIEVKATVNGKSVDSISLELYHEAYPEVRIKRKP